MLRLLVIVLAGVAMLVGWDLVENNGSDTQQLASVFTRSFQHGTGQGGTGQGTFMPIPPKPDLTPAWRRIAP